MCTPEAQRQRGASLIMRSKSKGACHIPQDWTKAGPHEQLSATTLQRRKDRVEHLRDTEPGPTGGEEVPRTRMSPATIAAKVSGPLPG